MLGCIFILPKSSKETAKLRFRVFSHPPFIPFFMYPSVKSPHDLTKQLAWEVVQVPVFTGRLANDYFVDQCTPFKALLRSDTGQLLNVARRTYTPTPNARFVEVAEKLSQVTGFVLSGFHSYQNGKKVLAYLKNHRQARVADFDFADYMVIGNAHDYSAGFFVGSASVMIRCSNQFSTISRQLRVQHTRHSPGRIEGIVRYFENYQTEQNRIFARMEDFARIRASQSLIDALVNRLTKAGEKVGGNAKVNGKLSASKTLLKERLANSIRQETSDIGMNLLGVFQGVTHYTTHVRKNNDATFGNLFGGAAQLNAQAYEFCLGQGRDGGQLQAA